MVQIIEPLHEDVHLLAHMRPQGYPAGWYELAFLVKKRFCLDLRQRYDNHEDPFNLYYLFCDQEEGILLPGRPDLDAMREAISSRGKVVIYKKDLVFQKSYWSSVWKKRADDPTVPHGA